MPGSVASAMAMVMAMAMVVVMVRAALSGRKWEDELGQAAKVPAARGSPPT